MTIGIIVLQTVADVFVAGVTTHPVAVGSSFCALVGVTLCAWEALERRGWRATAWAIGGVSSIAVLLATL